MPLTLSEVVLAAPDVDRDVFTALIPLLTRKAKGITLYASGVEKALLASQLKARGPRAGTFLHRVTRLYFLAWKRLTLLRSEKICLR
jgi:esterase/lipase superfamily enzyme